MRPNKSRQVKVAVVGLGFMGVTHLRVYQKLPNVRIVAVCGAKRLPENGVLRGVAGNIKKPDDIHLGAGVKVYRQFSELLADPDVELVDICTPTPVHAAQVIAALKAGKHVLCEKPLARTSADARKILAVADKSKTFLMPAMCMRFWPGWSQLKQIVAQKTYGRVLTASFHRVSQMPAWNSAQAYAGGDAGGALYDLHIHDTDFVNFLFGRPHSVFASGVVGVDGSVNHVITQYHFPGGPVVHAEGSWLLASGFNMTFTVNFERATVAFDFARGCTLQLSEAGRKTRSLKLKPTDGYAGEIKYFVDCVARGQRPEIVTPQDALTALEICEAEEKSIRRGVIVKL
ncbi:MAG TPA: Gfo/Idh/MocA family oxidoreductase [Verrucomicrobiae bacterium]|jgi:predicted dehydrogenase